MDIGTRIREARKSKGLSQIEISQIAKIAVNSLRLYEANKRQPRPDTLEAIANAIGVTPTYLIGYDEKIVNPEQYSPEQLEEFKTGAWEAYQQHIEETASPRAYLNAAFSKLNDKGQQEAVKRVEELTEIPKYQRQEPPAAPSEGTDTAPAENAATEPQEGE